MKTSYSASNNVVKHTPNVVEYSRDKYETCHNCNKQKSDAVIRAIVVPGGIKLMKLCDKCNNKIKCRHL